VTVITQLTGGASKGGGTAGEGPGGMGGTAGERPSKGKFDMCIMHQVHTSYRQNIECIHIFKNYLHKNC
jgi:hypothetical protein